MDFHESRLYRSAFADACTDKGEVRRRLAVALDGFRRRAAQLAGRIAQDLPGFTGHDIEHLDALWATADVITGDGWTLNPVEAFVFGAAVLLHDLGLSTAAYLEGPSAVERGADFADALRLALRAKLRREPTAGELADPMPEARNAAREAVLRRQHAIRAADLATSPLRGPEGDLYLLEDSELREDIGWLTGQIAASHSWGLLEVNTTFSGLAPAPKDLDGWPVDALTVACLLRCADAAQLDGRRARSLRQALERPVGESADHWNFQRRLHPARRDGDRLVFESTRPFDRSLADAWWLAYEWLSMANGELGAVDALLADRRPQRRFAARSVAGTDAPARLAERVRTDGWLPVDARLHVSDVTTLARRIGGQQLYGDTPEVPLRELVQNASDAIRARWVLDDNIREGAVTVALYREQDVPILEVHDDGVGMTQDVLTGPLLDFGASLWSSSAVAWHLPGLAATGFRSVGRFGVGFFAAFMWSDQVTVISRPLRGAAADTRVLDFVGLARRPLLRAANPHEQLSTSGTLVRLRLSQVDSVGPDRPKERLRSLASGPRDVSPDDLALTLPWLAPASEVDLLVRGRGKPRRVVRGGDWRTMPAERLLARVAGLTVSDFKSGAAEPLPFLDLLRPVVQDGEMVGRAALPLSKTLLRLGEVGVLTVGGLRAMQCERLVGLLLGEDPNVARTEARPVATRATLRAWAGEQARLYDGLNFPLALALRAAETVAGCGADTASLPICGIRDGPLDAVAFRQWAEERTARPIYLFDPTHAEDVSFMAAEDFRPAENVLVVRSFYSPPVWWQRAVGDESGHTLRGLCMSILREAWGGVDVRDADYPEELGTGVLGDIVSGYYEIVTAPDASRPPVSGR